jgi:hypothetical protein
VPAKLLADHLAYALAFLIAIDNRLDESDIDGAQRLIDACRERIDGDALLADVLIGPPLQNGYWDTIYNRALRVYCDEIDDPLLWESAEVQAR